MRSIVSSVVFESFTDKTKPGFVSRSLGTKNNREIEIKMKFSKLSSTDKTAYLQDGLLTKLTGDALFFFPMAQLTKPETAWSFVSKSQQIN